eukprot:scaffold93127_cov25-Tisochrysis_lutea.AAC.3
MTLAPRVWRGSGACIPSATAVRAARKMKTAWGSRRQQAARGQHIPKPAIADMARRTGLRSRVPSARASSFRRVPTAAGRSASSVRSRSRRNEARLATRRSTGSPRIAGGCGPIGSGASPPERNGTEGADSRGAGHRWHPPARLSAPSRFMAAIVSSMAPRSARGSSGRLQLIE